MAKAALARSREPDDTADAANLSPKVLKLAAELERLGPADKRVFVDLVLRRLPDAVLRDISANRSNTAPARAHRKAIAVDSMPEFAARRAKRSLLREPATRHAITQGRSSLQALLASDEFVTLSEAAQICAVTVQAIRHRVLAGKLFGLAGPGGVRLRYPVWQFSHRWPAGAMEQLLAAMSTRSALEKYRFFTTPNPRLSAGDGRGSSRQEKGSGPMSPLDLLGISRTPAGIDDDHAALVDPRALAAVLDLARVYGAELHAGT